MSCVLGTCREQDSSECQGCVHNIECPLTATQCHHFNFSCRYYCDKEDLRCAMRQMETFKKNG